MSLSVSGAKLLLFGGYFKTFSAENVRENVRLYQLIDKNSEYSRRRNELEAKHYGGEESACYFAVVGKLVV